MPIGLGIVVVIALVLLANYIESLKNAHYSRLFTWLFTVDQYPHHTIGHCPHTAALGFRF